MNYNNVFFFFLRTIFNYIKRKVEIVLENVYFKRVCIYTYYKLNENVYSDKLEISSLA